MTAEKNVFTTHLMENSVNGVVSKQGKLCRLKSQHDSLNNNKLYHHSLQTQRICVSIKHNSDTQMYISSLYFLLCWQIQQKDKSSATVLYVSLMALIKVIFPFYPWADLFSHSFFFISETAVNYWLTWVLITMQIWGKMKSKAAGSCHIPVQ